MSMLRYAVLLCDGEWRVVGGSRRIGHYADQESAVVAGARLAREAQATGHEVEFLVQGEAGELVRHDPAPLASPTI